MILPTPVAKLVLDPQPQRRTMVGWEVGIVSLGIICRFGGDDLLFLTG